MAGASCSARPATRAITTGPLLREVGGKECSFVVVTASTGQASERSIEVPYAGLPLQMRSIKQEVLQAIDDVLEHGIYIMGPELSDFERQFAAYCGTRYAVGVSDGTSALILTLRGLGIGPGDEVITAPNSFVA